MNRNQLEEAGQLFSEAKKAMANADYTTAIRQFRRVLVSGPHFKVLELLGECLLKRGKPREAIVYLGAAAALSGRLQSRARFLLAKAFVELGDRDNAVRQLQESLRISPAYPAAQNLLKQLKSGNA